jgi:hypothetical protein
MTAIPNSSVNLLNEVGTATRRLRTAIADQRGTLDSLERTLDRGAPLIMERLTPSAVEADGLGAVLTALYAVVKASDSGLTAEDFAAVLKGTHWADVLQAKEPAADRPTT